MEPKTKKGLIIGGSVLGVVLIGTAITLGIVLSGSKVSLHDGPVNVYGYDDNKTSTGMRQNTWMGIQTGVDGVHANDWIVENNPSYKPVENSEDMISGVKSDGGLGYLSNTEVSMYPDDLMALSISEDNGATWIAPDSSEYIAAPLNSVMKVPQAVSVKLKEVYSKTGAELKISELDGLTNAFDLSGTPASYDYGTWLKTNSDPAGQSYTKSFATAYLTFAWIAGANPAHEALNDSKFATPNTDTWATADEFESWANTVFGGEDRETWGVIDASGNISIGNYQLSVDGTGTDEFALDVAIESFNDAFGSNIIQMLNNGGSYRAWETTDASNLPPGVTYNEDEYDHKEEGIAYSFLGTQSRGMEVKSTPADGETAYWGYVDGSYTGTSFSHNGVQTDDLENIIYEFNTFQTTEDVPFASTIGGDNIVFFTQKDSAFTNKDGDIELIEGVTREGLNAIYSHTMTTWVELDNANYLLTEEA